MSGPHSNAARTDELTTASVMMALAVAVVSVLFVAAGIAWPQAASSLLRLLVAALAILYLTTRAWRILGDVRRTPKEYTPFDGPLGVRDPPGAPRDLLRLTAELDVAAQPDIGQRALIPRSTARMLAAEVQSRLERRHGLDTRVIAHHARIAALVSAPTSRLVLTAATAPREQLHITVAELDQILQDVERL